MNNTLSQLLEHAAFLQQIRQFFTDKNILEVQTPCLSKDLVPELNVAPVSLQHRLRGEKNSDYYLLPSPELRMKELLRAAQHSIFQFSHCFRAEEELGPYHQIEFLMLEWYQVSANALDNLNFLKELLSHLRNTGTLPLLPRTPEVMSFEQVCQKLWKLSFDHHWKLGLEGMKQLYCQLGASLPQTELNLDEVFHLFLVDFLEPAITKNFPYIYLYPYPNVTPLPAKTMYKQNGRDLWSDRWELYLFGIELANACTEENRPLELKEYLANMRESANKITWNEEQILAWQDLPQCSGVALGLMRLYQLGKYGRVSQDGESKSSLL